MDHRVPETRYAKTLDGGYIAYKSLGVGEADVAIVGSIATNIELFMEFEPAARSWFDLASSARVTLHDRRGTGRIGARVAGIALPSEVCVSQTV